MAHLLALRTGGEVILMDSMKVYRGIDVATAKPSAGRRAEVAYHLIDLLDPAGEFSVGEYMRLALGKVAEIEARGRRVIFSGGTALYLWALCGGLFVGPPADWELRRELQEEVRSGGLAGLHRRLGQLDPAAASRIHPNDERRIVRALEVRLRTGTALTDLWHGEAARLAEGTYRIFGVARERPALYRRIDARVERMVATGLFEEARGLAQRPGGLGRAAAQCIGLKEVLWGESQGISRQEVIAAIQKRTRRLAKQQLTWLRRFPIHWVEAQDDTTPEDLAERILQSLGSHAG